MGGRERSVNNENCATSDFAIDFEYSLCNRFQLITIVRSAFFFIEVNVLLVAVPGSLKKVGLFFKRLKRGFET